eukprot:CAMPEP_0198307382 /NCGR_PEP_ID=MMETSP1450-20131203/272_1 /TAXON_ID=753684 ORGANISM="Madagascaria erythrocladiodes, Strain CCMP3234" /NCGR_SAMPLE_ID=MMETSP1450 /ASSEMBLY_ACC=CAM_ASM_001115 /LENGTH=480 /DNA_ID=CAMNT_0044009961 /DNA_START=38 /DNA_END=1478 /DNA_ORIENTATION=+
MGGQTSRSQPPEARVMCVCCCGGGGVVWHRAWSVLEHVVAHVEAAVEDVERVANLGLGRHERWQDEHLVAAHHGEEAVLDELVLERDERRRQRLVHLGDEVAAAVLLHVEAAEHADDARLLDARVALEQRVEAVHHHRLHALRVAHHVVLEHVPQRAVRRREHHRVRVVRRADTDRVRAEVLGDWRAQPDHAERQERAVDALGARHNVRDHAVRVLEAEPAARAPEAVHHLVANEHNAVLVAQLAQAAQVARRRANEAVGARDGLDDDGGHGVRALGVEQLAHVREVVVRHLVGRLAPAERVRPRVHEVHVAVRAVLGRPAAQVAGHGERGGGSAVVRAVAREHLVAARVEARDAHRRFVRLGARAREQERVDVARQDVGEQRAEARAHGRHRHARVAVRERVELLAHRVEHLGRRRVTEVQAHGAAVHVHVPLAVGVDHIHALTALEPHAASIIGFVMPHVIIVCRSAAACTSAALHAA